MCQSIKRCAYFKKYTFGRIYLFKNLVNTLLRSRNRVNKTDPTLFEKSKLVQGAYKKSFFHIDNLKSGYSSLNRDFGNLSSVLIKLDF